MIKWLALLLLAHTQMSFASDYGIFAGEQDHSEQARLIRKATVAIVQNDRLFEKDTPLLSDYYRFCISQPFESEKIWSNCSGVLVAKNIVLTAGHCLSGEASCGDKSYVFDYLSNSDIPRIQNDKKQIYQCKKILAWSKPVSGKQLVDYALIQLDRDVTDRQPIPVPFLQITQQTELTAYGFPLGMPMKISKGFVAEDDVAANSRLNTSFARLSMATHPGLSGGGVYDNNYNLVGLLVRGAANIERDGRCQRIRDCEKGDCPWAEVQRLNYQEIAKILRQKSE